MAVTLNSIPTIRQLYAASKLVNAASSLYPARSSHLDRVSLMRGDITALEVDAIINAANESLLGGGGVDGAIHSAAGPSLLTECRKLNGCETGDAKMTRGYNLPSKHVIHTPGPVYKASRKSTCESQLLSCYTTSLNHAISANLKSIAFPSISTGVYGYPIKNATHVALRAVRETLDVEDKLERIVFVVFSEEDHDVYVDMIPQYFPAE